MGTYPVSSCPIFQNPVHDSAITGIPALGRGSPHTLRCAAPISSISAEIFRISSLDGSPFSHLESESEAPTTIDKCGKALLQICRTLIRSDYNPYQITEAEMKACSRCRKLLALEDFAQKNDARDGRQSRCKRCVNECNREKYADDPEVKTKKDLRRVRRELEADWGQRRAKELSSKREYMAQRMKTEAEKTYRATAKAARSPAQKLCEMVFYRLRRSGHCPHWVKPKSFLPFYELAKSLGPEWSVDHVIPLRGVIVSGLHVPSNLQVIKGVANSRKHNHFDPDNIEVAGLRPKL